MLVIVRVFVMFYTVCSLSKRWQLSNQILSLIPSLSAESKIKPYTRQRMSKTYNICSFFIFLLIFSHSILWCSQQTPRMSRVNSVSDGNLETAYIQGLSQDFGDFYYTDGDIK